MKEHYLQENESILEHERWKRSKRKNISILYNNTTKPTMWSSYYMEIGQKWQKGHPDWRSISKIGHTDIQTAEYECKIYLFIQFIGGFI